MPRRVCIDAFLPALGAIGFSGWRRVKLSKTLWGRKAFVALAGTLEEHWEVASKKKVFPVLAFQEDARGQ
eukprot:2195574-Pyramimonas_sp.AAC.1